VEGIFADAPEDDWPTHTFITWLELMVRPAADGQEHIGSQRQMSDRSVCAVGVSERPLCGSPGLPALTCCRPPRFSCRC